MSGRGGANALVDVPEEAREMAMDMAAEVLSVATAEAVVAATVNLPALDAVLTAHLGFIETCGQDLAMPTDLRTQLLRVVAMLDTQALLTTLEKQVKAQIRRCCEAADEALRERLHAVIDKRFEAFSAAVVAVRIAS
eukprot:TRINITY_DN7280_c0_g2_i3.p2 TRINITY_DN7280_c0_g2~~TRINITY_DN7280_c0_g2_i3.p2  ORF type:complete len:137 (-),score=34.21 TRINITY_DN7280_c0_g2_i3:180-590(-)